MRLRIFPINEFITMIKEGVVVEVARAVLGLLQHDELVPGSGPVGFYNLYPKFDSLRLGARKGHATVQCEFQEKSGLEVATCPRTFLRTMIERCKDNGLEFLVGFEIEVVFMKSVVIGNVVDYLDPINQGHSWSGSRPFHDDNTMTLVLDIVERLKKSSISIQQFHAETAPSQFEFVLGPKTPLAAVDELLSAREIIFETAAKHSMRATLVPKPYTHKAGTGSHIHLSVTPSDIYPKFYAGVLKHLRAITAFTCSNITSFDRIVASSWAGGTFVSWGTQNRETALRRIKGSHFEIKCTDGFANMYLAVGAIIGAGLQGYLDSEELTIQDCPVDPATLSDKEREKLGITQKLPASVEEALDCLRQDSQFRQVLGFPIVDAYLAVKQAECSMLGAMDPEKRRNWLIARY